MNRRVTGTLLAMVMALLLTACASRSERELGQPSTEDAARYNTQLGVAYMRQGRRELALEKLERALAADSRYAPAHSATALLYEQIGDEELAKHHYERAIRYGDDDPSIQNNYGAYLCRLGEYEEAVSYLVQAAENARYETPAAAYTNAGVCARKGGELEAAGRYLRRALEVAPRYEAALLQLANISAEQGEHLAARAFIQRLEEIGPLTAEVLALAVRVERSLGDEEAAQRYARRLRRDHPDAPQTRDLTESGARDGGD